MKAEFVACFEARVQADWLWKFISEIGIIDSISKLKEYKLKNAYSQDLLWIKVSALLCFIM